MTARHPSPDIPPHPDHGHPMPAGTPASGERRPRRLRRQLARLRVLPALAAVAVIAAACSSTAATSTPNSTVPVPHHGGHHRGAGIVGKVTTISASSLVVDVRGTTRTVALTPATRYRQGHQDVTASALSPGEHVRVRTAANGNATVVTILPATVTGTIIALDSHGFTLHTPHGTTLTVTATASATYRDGSTTVTASFLKPGQKLHMQGQPGPNGSFTATKITVTASGSSG